MQSEEISYQYWPGNAEEEEEEEYQNWQWNYNITNIEIYIVVHKLHTDPTLHTAQNPWESLSFA